MTPLIIIGAIAGGLLIATLVLRVNAIFLFVALATGELLSRFLAHDAGLVLSMLSKTASIDVVATIALLWLPIVLTLLLLRGSLPRSTLLLQIIPITISCAAVAMLSLSALPAGFQHSVFATAPFGNIVNQAHDIIIAAAGIATFLLVIVIGRPHHDEGKHR